MPLNVQNSFFMAKYPIGWVEQMFRNFHRIVDDKCILFYSFVYRRALLAIDNITPLHTSEVRMLRDSLIWVTLDNINTLRNVQ